MALSVSFAIIQHDLNGEAEQDNNDQCDKQSIGGIFINLREMGSNRCG